MRDGNAAEQPAEEVVDRVSESYDDAVGSREEIGGRAGEKAVSLGSGSRDERGDLLDGKELGDGGANEGWRSSRVGDVEGERRVCATAELLGRRGAFGVDGEGDDEERAE